MEAGSFNLEAVAMRVGISNGSSQMTQSLGMKKDIKSMASSSPSKKNMQDMLKTAKETLQNTNTLTLAA